MSMQVKPGRKLTEAGVIPGDWNAGELKNYCTRLNVGFVGTCEPFYTSETKGIMLIRTGNLKNESFSFEDMKFVTKSFHDSNKKSQVRVGDILIARHGDSGTAVLVPESVDRANTLNIVIIRPDNAMLDNKFSAYAINSYGVKKQVIESSAGSTQSVINTKEIAKLIIPLPSLPEQYAIGNALTSIDALISGLDQLIVKKQDIKQATMQQLLTGQRRLLGFSGEWEVKPMRTLGCTYGGLAGKTKSNFGHGNARYIPFMNVMTDTVIDPNWLETVDVAPDEVQNLAKKGDLFFNGSSETPEEVGFCSVLLEDIPRLYLNSFCFGFRFNSSAKVNGLFFAYWFRSKPGRTATSVLAQGATRYNIAKGAFMQLEIPQPSEEEQTAIATILSDMDGELATLKIQCKKARQIKLGMMQELLTGRIRLI